MGLYPHRLSGDNQTPHEFRSAGNLSKEIPGHVETIDSKNNKAGKMAFFSSKDKIVTL